MASGYIRTGASGRRSSGKLTTRKHKTGSARTTAKPSRSHSGGRTTISAPTGSGSTTRPSSSNKKQRGVVSQPFWSQAMAAFVIEYREPDARMFGGWWESKIFAARAEDAAAMYKALRKVATRKEWMEVGHVTGKQVALLTGEYFLYRVVMGERAESFKER